MLDSPKLGCKEIPKSISLTVILGSRVPVDNLVSEVDGSDFALSVRSGASCGSCTSRLPSSASSKTFDGLISR